MSRAIRPNLPGVPFHLTARLQNHEPLFRGLEREVATLILERAHAGRVSVVAYSVMPNHLHIIVVQGERPLSRYMQPLLRNTALLLMRRWRREGHMFERRYHASACLTAEYFRNAIAYVHLNPVRAGLCSDPATYPWSSCRDFGRVSARPTEHELAAVDGVRMFAKRAAESPERCRRNHDGYLVLRRRMDAADALGSRFAVGPLPLFRGGDAWWNVWLGRAAALRAAGDAFSAVARPSLRQIAEQVLAEHAPEMDMDTLRSGSRSRPVVHVRRTFIVQATRAGHLNRQIARFLDVSSTTVSAAKMVLATGSR